MTVRKTCKGCDKRHVGCHASCEDYIAWRKQHTEEMEALKEWIVNTKPDRKGYNDRAHHARRKESEE